MKADLTDRERAFVYLGKYAGLRKGESLALSKNDFDMKKREISVNKTLIFVGNKAIIEPFPKTDAGVRKIPMPDILYNFIKDYLKKIKTMYLFTTASSELCQIHRMIRCGVPSLRSSTRQSGQKEYTTYCRSHFAHSPP